VALGVEKWQRLMTGATRPLCCAHFSKAPLELGGQTTEWMGLYSELSLAGLVEAAAFHNGYGKPASRLMTKA
jgi:hypothetical protein